MKMADEISLEEFKEEVASSRKKLLKYKKRIEKKLVNGINSLSLDSILDNLTNEHIFWTNLAHSNEKYECFRGNLRIWISGEGNLGLYVMGSKPPFRDIHRYFRKDQRIEELYQSIKKGSNGDN